MSLFATGRSPYVPLVSKASFCYFTGLIVTALLFVAGIGRAQPLVPPAPPPVAPVISGAYSSDTDGDRIDDSLQGRATEAEVSSSISADLDRRVGTSSVGEVRIDVELIFREPVTQQQIDAFLGLGGEITHMYKAVSYGWNGRIALRAIESLPSVMGSSLALVEPTRQVEPYMDVASQTGRVRPVWRPGFARSVEGFDGDANITIGFVVDGIDGTHPDLAGRCAYWSDLSGEDEPSPVDYFGHGSMAAGIAVGTGDADTLVEPALHYTYVGDFSSWQHVVDPISFVSSTYVQVESQASWTGGSAILAQIRWIKGGYFDDLDWIGRFVWGASELDVSNSYLASQKQVFSVLLEDLEDRELDQVVITNSVSKYPSVDDGFPRFRGVAPACRWASARVDVHGEWGEADGLSQSLDDLVQHREAHNIKIINISHGLVEDGLPCESQSLRDKVNSAVRNGIVVVSAAGNSAYAPSEALREMADPPRAALAITVGASNDENALTYYSSYGFTDPDHARGEDHKPDLIAPGGSIHQTGMMSVDSGSSDGYGTPDKQPNDYANEEGTSFASPFVAGCAALVIDAMQQKGLAWDFHSDAQPRFVKMVLCATASETGAEREEWHDNPSLERAAEGSEGFPRGKDRYEGYGIINADAAVEAVYLTYTGHSDVDGELGPGPTDRRVWARKVNLIAGGGIDVELDNPSGGDFDLYLYSGVPSETGTPVILACSTRPGEGVDEVLSYVSASDVIGLLVVKRVFGSGMFELRSVQPVAPLAQDAELTVGLNSARTVTLAATDDGLPNPPGALTYTIVSLPTHGQLERLGTGLPIATVPTTLEKGVEQVVYRPDPDWLGADSFTYSAHDGGTAPLGGRSNTATVKITAVQDITVTYQVSAPLDDASAKRWSTYQKLNDPALAVGQYTAGMRFCNVEIPKGAHIVKAVLKVRSHADGLSGTSRAVLRAEAADNPGEFSSSHRVSGVTTTNASLVWDWGTTWSSETWYESPDVGAVIQEVIDRPGWSTSNAIVILCAADGDAGSDRKFWSYDGDPDSAAQLEITYQP